MTDAPDAPPGVFRVTPLWFTGKMAEAHGNLIGDLKGAIDALVAAGPEAIGDGTGVIDLVRQAQRLSGVVCSAVSVVDASGEWRQDAAYSASTWLSSRCRLPLGEARRMCRLGRTMGEMPETAQAWLTGEIGAAHAGILAPLATGRTAESFRRDEEMLVAHARALSFHQFCQAVRYWDQLADPDGCEEADERRRTRRDVSLSQTFLGMWTGSMTLDPLSGAIVAGELARIEQGLFATDVEDARGKQEAGLLPPGAPLARTPAQRRADALVEMATRSRSAPEDGRRPSPLFTVLVDYETLQGRVCELANGHVVTPGSLVPWLTQADIERVVFHKEGRVEVSAASRFFSGATRRAIEVRDRTCSHPTCEVPAERCQVDHILPWSAGGATTQENGRLLCGFHNRLRNERPRPSG